MVTMVLQSYSDFLSENTGRYQHTGLTPEFLNKIHKVLDAIKSAGYEPYDQLTGYVRSGNACYITRKGDARETVLSLDIQDIKTFLIEYNHIP